MICPRITHKRAAVEDLGARFGAMRVVWLRRACARAALLASLRRALSLSLTNPQVAVWNRSRRRSLMRCSIS